MKSSVWKNQIKKLQLKVETPRSNELETWNALQKIDEALEKTKLYNDLKLIAKQLLEFKPLYNDIFTNDCFFYLKQKCLKKNINLQKFNRLEKYWYSYYWLIGNYKNKELRKENFRLSYCTYYEMKNVVIENKNVIGKLLHNFDAKEVIRTNIEYIAGICVSLTKDSNVKNYQNFTYKFPKNTITNK